MEEYAQKITMVLVGISKNGRFSWNRQEKDNSRCKIQTTFAKFYGVVCVNFSQVYIKPGCQNRASRGFYTIFDLDMT